MKSLLILGLVVVIVVVWTIGTRIGYKLCFSKDRNHHVTGLDAIMPDVYHNRNKQVAVLRIQRKLTSLLEAGLRSVDCLRNPSRSPAARRHHSLGRRHRSRDSPKRSPKPLGAQERVSRVWGRASGVLGRGNDQSLRRRLFMRSEKGRMRGSVFLSSKGHVEEWGSPLADQHPLFTRIISLKVKCFRSDESPCKASYGSWFHATQTIF